MRKRAAALVLCLLLMLQITAPSVRAEQSVYFVAVGSNVLPLTDATMPFWSGGYLYISSSIFTGVVWSAVGISHVPANARQPLILYSGCLLYTSVRPGCCPGLGRRSRTSC